MPSATRGMFEPGMFFGFPFLSYFPSRGPIIITDASAAAAPAMWTIPEPAKSRNPSLAKNPPPQVQEPSSG